MQKENIINNKKSVAICLIRPIRVTINRNTNKRMRKKIYGMQKENIINNKKSVAICLIRPIRVTINRNAD